MVIAFNILNLCIVLLSFQFITNLSGLAKEGNKFRRVAAKI
jgi:hypothetical protein